MLINTVNAISETTGAFACHGLPPMILTFDVGEDSLAVDLGVGGADDAIEVDWGDGTADTLTNLRSYI